MGSRAAGRSGRSAAGLLVRHSRRARCGPSRAGRRRSSAFRTTARWSGTAGRTINTLRLWSAATPDYFDFQQFSGGDFVGALAETLTAETLTRVLYPDDSTTEGKGLRFLQQYFLVACTLADAIRRFRAAGNDWSALPDKVAMQLNDTHPTLAVPELMRILLDEAKLGWDEAWDLTQRTLAYTNHTLLPEALEKWPLPWFEMMLPRQLEIIYEINRRFLDDVRDPFPGDDGRLARVSLIEEGAAEEDPHGAPRHRRLAQHQRRGGDSLGAAHADRRAGLRRAVPRPVQQQDQRRHAAALPPARESAARRGDHRRHRRRLDRRSRASSRSSSRWPRTRRSARRFASAKREAKVRFAGWLKSATGQVVDPESIFDTQIKRIHEYKRQLLNALHIVVLYNRLRENPERDVPPRTFFFAGKAAPAYHFAKLVIKFINNLGATIDGDPAMRGRLKVVFVPDYSVSIAERLIPASDVSEQISTAGYEASGTGNMKLMMNGALTIGTRDGATIEMAAAAGEENFFLFGLSAEEVASSRGRYNPQWHYDNEPETRAALDLIAGNHFSRNEPGDVRRRSSTSCFARATITCTSPISGATARRTRGWASCIADQENWSRKAVLNIAASRTFSSDRTIAEYARDIWHAEPCPVE